MGSGQAFLGRLRTRGLALTKSSPIHQRAVVPPGGAADLRLQRRFPPGGRAGIDGIVEVFNVFNHANYGSYTTQEVSRNYGLPAQNLLVAYAPRMLQLGFRFAC